MDPATKKGAARRLLKVSDQSWDRVSSAFFLQIAV